MVTFDTILHQALKGTILAGLRSYLAIVAVGMGVASMVALLNIGYITKSSILESYEALGYRITKLEIHDLPSVNAVPKLSEFAQLIRGSTLVHSTELIMTSFGHIEFDGEVQNVSIHSISKTLQTLLNIHIERGELLTPSLNSLPTALIGHDITAHAAERNALMLPGALTTMNSTTPLAIAGTLSAQPTEGVLTGGSNNAIFVLNSELSRLDLVPQIATILVFRKKDSHHSDIENMASLLYESNFVAHSAVEVISPEDLINNINQQKRAQNILIASLGIFSLLSGGIGIMSVMLIAVKERRPEIGIRLAIGARPKDIKHQFIIESIILCILGSIIGILVGLIFTYIYAYFQNWQYSVSFMTIVSGATIGTTIGMVFGYYPATIASNLDPIDVLMG